MKNAQQEINQLRESLWRHNRLYYVEARPEISDLEYDQLLKQLEALEEEHPELISDDSPTQRVGGEPIEGFSTVPHRLPMLSIDNVYSEDELQEFHQRIVKLLPEEEIEYSVEYKIDGVALALVYENGRLVQAVTRGDGQQGDDITQNARAIRDVPLKLESDNPPAVLEIRGEAYIPNSDFAEIRKQQIEAGEQPFANPRNSTAGALKLLDAKLSADRKVRFFAHGIGFHEGTNFETHTDYIKTLREYGISTTPRVQSFPSFEKAMEYSQGLMADLHELDFEVDGLVFKVNRLEQRERLGNTSKSPRWLIAFKWERYEAETTVKSIFVQVGKTGTLTPVADLEPVEIAGTTVSRSSLHNRDELERLEVRIGDRVIVEKAGKIIPHVVRVEKQHRKGKEIEFKFPEQCPECQTKAIQDEGGVYIRCPNLSCPARLRESLRYFTSRSAMDIEGLGIKLIEQLIENQFVTSFADLYRLHLKRDELLKLERMGEKSVDKMITGIEASKTQPLWRLLTGLNIRHVGTSNARILMDRFGTVDNIIKQSQESLAEVDEIGDIIAESVQTFFHSEYGSKLITELRELGLNLGDESSIKPIPTEEVDSQAGVFAGKSFVVTGTLQGYSRTEAQELIREHGGKPSSSISSKTDYLLAGEKAGSKLIKAEKLGVTILTEEEWLGMIEV